jgi:hypothetical protein
LEDGAAAAFDGEAGGDLFRPHVALVVGLGIAVDEADQVDVAGHAVAGDGSQGLAEDLAVHASRSFKVYSLQHTTRSIVDRLQGLAPGRPLNPWFSEIVQTGTGKKFKFADNARWLEETRPILEAFFHARFFLEMAVRYAGLDAPPNPLPSGYAALLSLYGLR